MKLKRFVYIHLNGCGRLAFTLTYEPRYAETLTSKGAFHLNGSPIVDGSGISCDSCGGNIRPLVHCVISSRVYMEDQGAVQ